MAQIASDAKGKPVMSLALKKLAKPVTEGKNTFVAAAEFRTKLGVFLPQGVTFAIDGGKKRRIPFERCLPEGCAALPLIQKGLVDELKSGGKVIMTVYANPKTPITVSVSLSGFTAAFDSMK
ncbi:MAG: invasion associated locus B family protein [Neomegalonema sp.]|nr:invasion associated locus B family protein [Neomegalonema sp.]